MQDMVWRWELTPRQASPGFKFWSPPFKDFRVEAPFESPRHQLQGTPFDYQVAVSKLSRSLDVSPVRAAQPELAESGSRRSGIILFQGEQVVGSYCYPGTKFHEDVRLSVHPEHRRQGLGRLLIHLWFRHTMRVRDIEPQNMTTFTARAYVAAQIEISRWAVEQGKDVPEAVRRELETGEEERYLRRLIDEVERTGDPVWVGGTLDVR